MTVEQSLLIIGAGNLGGRVGELWRAQFPQARVVAETESTGRHERLARSGLEPRLRQSPGLAPAPWVLFAVPPSAAADYAGEATRAAQMWSGQGRLVAVSSTAVYAERDGGACAEDGPLASTDRAERLLAAERAIRDAGGSVVRMAGLYDFERGPHRVFLRLQDSPRRPDGLVNLVHYDDAATLCLAALLRGQPAAVYLGCDGQPVTRQQLLDLSLDAGLWGTPAVVCRFTGRAGDKGRRCENGRTAAILQWEPRHRSFEAWLAGQAR